VPSPVATSRKSAPRCSVPIGERLDRGAVAGDARVGQMGAEDRRSVMSRLWLVPNSPRRSMSRRGDLGRV
jgi:hypothetical protein